MYSLISDFSKAAHRVPQFPPQGEHFHHRSTFFSSTLLFPFTLPQTLAKFRHGVAVRYPWECSTRQRRHVAGGISGEIFIRRGALLMNWRINLPGMWGSEFRVMCCRRPCCHAANDGDDGDDDDVESDGKVDVETLKSSLVSKRRGAGCDSGWNFDWQEIVSGRCFFLSLAWFDALKNDYSSWFVEIGHYMLISWIISIPSSPPSGEV